MIKEGRQYGTSLSDIREDHRRRYEFAANRLYGTTRIVDLGCGYGYGSYILAMETMAKIYSLDFDKQVLHDGSLHFRHERIERWHTDIQSGIIPVADAVVAFEVIEHVENPQRILSSLRSEHLIGSVPNQETTPFDPKNNPWHHQHYTLNELRELIRNSGWSLCYIWGQRGKRGREALIEDESPETAREARTLIFEAVR